VKKTAWGLVLSLLLSSLAQAETKDWAQFRGPDSAGPKFAGNLPTVKFGLQVAWKRDLGSGYSNVWIESGKGVTMHTDAAVDVVTAFELSSGKTLWRYELGPKHAGHDGSDDGPIGTPTVSDGVVYALGPVGQLVALGLADGAVKWRRELDAQSSSVPFYGFASSPLVLGKQVMVATGGDGHAVTAFDRETGKTLWAAGEDSISYQTPVLAELGGKRQLLVVSDHLLQGIDPTDGKVLWKLRHTEGDQPEQSAHPTVVDGERFLVKFGEGARMYRYADGNVKELWRSNAFGNSLALPVLVGDHFYGFTGTVLTCASAATGEIVWRSREGTSLGLSAVDGLLAITTRTGELLLVDPSPQAYREVARVPVLDAGNYAVPTFADGTFIVRNLKAMAAVRVDASVAPKVAQVTTTERLRGDFGKWVASVEKMPEAKRQAAVDRRFPSSASSPLIEGQNLAHVVWKGKAKDVALTGDIVPDGQEQALYAVAGTDLFFRTFELDPKAQYTYDLVVDYADPSPDPRNPRSVNNGGAGVASELRMPDWPASPHVEPPAEGAPRGTLDKFQFRSLILDNTREIQVWRPADYGRDRAKRYPVLVANHGDNLIRGELMQNTLDNLVGKTVEPLIAVFVPRAAGPEYGGPQGEAYTRFLVEELLPNIDRNYRTDPARRAIMGPGSAGVAAMAAAFQRPQVFQKAAVQSFYPIPPTQDRLPGLITAAGPKPELVYVVYSNHDYDVSGRRAEEASRELIGQLRTAKVNVVEQVADYSPGWAGWRGQDDEILAALFPLPKAAP
jgi:enterochelin esterase-like enzyme